MPLLVGWPIPLCTVSHWNALFRSQVGFANGNLGSELGDAFLLEIRTNNKVVFSVYDNDLHDICKALK